MGDQDIQKAIQQGGQDKEDAVQYLINEHIGFIHKMHRQLKLSTEEAKDAYTDAVLALIQSIENQRFDGKSKLSTYLYRIFYFKCVDLSRKNATNPIAYVEQIPDTAAEERGSFRQLLIKDEVKNLHRQLDRIGDLCRQILLDWGFWGYKMDEIARRNGLADAGKAKRQKYNCLQKLLKVLKAKPIQND